MSDLRLWVLDNIKDIGNEVNNYLQEINNSKESYIMDANLDRFSNGEGKARVASTIRDKDIYILSDVGNYGITYNMHGMKIPMSPDEHFQDIKRCVSALSGYARRITIITPLLYQSRQHKRKGCESLDCAMALQELERLHVNHIVTFDAHDRNVSNAIPHLPFENFFPTNIILEELIKKEKIKDVLIISPDMGAVERARYYADMLCTNVGVFYKRRDLTKIVDGKNPVVEHVYMGPDVKDKTILVVDDMIASGNSIIEVGKMLKEKGAKRVYFITTFCLFTEGIEVFSNAHKEKIFDKIYTTNLSYIPKKYQRNKWLEVVNCSYRIAQIIDCINKGSSLRSIVDSNKRILELINKQK